MKIFKLFIFVFPLAILMAGCGSNKNDEKIAYQGKDIFVHFLGYYKTPLEGERQVIRHPLNKRE